MVESANHDLPPKKKKKIVPKMIEAWPTAPAVSGNLSNTSTSGTTPSKMKAQPTDKIKSESQSQKIFKVELVHHSDIVENHEEEQIQNEVREAEATLKEEGADVIKVEKPGFN